MNEFKIDIESRWSENIAKARSLVNTRKKNQMLVAELAMEVCDISWGGSSKEFASRFTLSRFAKEVGVNFRSISSWIAVKKKAFDKLPRELREKANYTQLAHMSAFLPMDATKKEVLVEYNRIVCGDPFEAKMLRYLADARSIHFNFVKMDAASKISPEALEDFFFYTSGTVEAIKKNNPSILTRLNNLAGKNNPSVTQSAAAAILSIRGRRGSSETKDVDGQIVKIKPKDRDILNFLKNKEKFTSPTEIGMYLGRKSSNSASGWCNSSLNKLVALGVIKRNKFGHYQYINVGDENE